MFVDCEGKTWRYWILKVNTALTGMGKVGIEKTVVCFCKMSDTIVFEWRRCVEQGKTNRLERQFSGMLFCLVLAQRG